jgi:hypothetical protein
MTTKTHVEDIQRSIDAQVEALVARGIERRPDWSAVQLPEDEEETWLAPVAASAPKATPRQLAEMEKHKLQATLESRMTFLVDLKQKLKEDPDLLGFVDSMIANQVKQSEKRLRTHSASITTVVSILSLIAGWLLTALTPTVTIAHLMGH